MRRTFIALLIVCGSTLTALHPASAAPSITVTPSTGLVEGQQVTVALSGFGAGESLLFGACPTGGGLLSCDESSAVNVTVDASGRASVPFTVHLALNTPNGFVNCQASAGRCSLAVTTNPITSIVTSTPLLFVTPGPARRGTASISSPVVDVTLAPIATTGATVNAAIAVDACAPNPQSAADCATAQYGGTDANGAGAVKRTMTASETTGSGQTLDCSVSGACVAAVWDVRDFAATVATASYVVVPQTAGTFAVAPSIDLVDGQVVTLSGSGWSPGASLLVGECRHGATDVSGCDASSARTIRIASDGSFHQGYAVAASGQLRCGAARFACDLVVAGNGLVLLGRVPIAFAAHTVAVTSSYGPRQYALIAQAATQLDVTLAELQRLGTLQEAARLGASGAGNVVAPTSSPIAVTTVWCITQYDALTAVAQGHGLTLGQLQIIGTLRLARSTVAG
jgi:hypothetical protein